MSTQVGSQYKLSPKSLSSVPLENGPWHARDSSTSSAVVRHASSTRSFKEEMNRNLEDSRVRYGTAHLVMSDADLLKADQTLLRSCKTLELQLEPGLFVSTARWQRFLNFLMYLSEQRVFSGLVSLTLVGTSSETILFLFRRLSPALQRLNMSAFVPLSPGLVYIARTWPRLIELHLNMNTISSFSSLEPEGATHDYVLGWMSRQMRWGLQHLELHGVDRLSSTSHERLFVLPLLHRLCIHRSPHPDLLSHVDAAWRLATGVTPGPFLEYVDAEGGKRYTYYLQRWRVQNMLWNSEALRLVLFDSRILFPHVDRHTSFGVVQHDTTFSKRILAAGE